MVVCVYTAQFEDPKSPPPARDRASALCTSKKKYAIAPKNQANQASYGVDNILKHFSL